MYPSQLVLLQANTRSTGGRRTTASETLWQGLHGRYHYRSADQHCHGLSPVEREYPGCNANGACLRSFNISSRTMLVLAGSCGNAGFVDGTLTQARFDLPTDVAVRERDGSIFLADSGNSIIRWIRPDLHSVSTLAGTQGSGHA